MISAPSSDKAGPARCQPLSGIAGDGRRLDDEVSVASDAALFDTLLLPCLGLKVATATIRAQTGAVVEALRFSSHAEKWWIGRRPAGPDPDQRRQPIITAMLASPHHLSPV